MIFNPLPHYFIVKINKDTQSQRREKVGSLYLHFQEVFMQRNMQCGEIVAIGSEAKKIFPTAVAGDVVIFHHFVEGDSKKSNLLYSDNEYNYYFVTISDYNGHRNETYGVFKDNKVIPHPDFIFIKSEVKEVKSYENQDEYIEQNTEKVGSLILFSNWSETREDKEAKASQLMIEIKNQTKSKNLTDSTKRALEIKQKEAEDITANLNRKEYKPYTLQYAHPSSNITEDKKMVYALSLAAQTELEFGELKYNIINTRYCAASA